MSVAAVGTQGASASAVEGTAAGTAADTAELGHTAGIHSAAAVECTGRSSRPCSRTAGCIADPWLVCIVRQGAITRRRIMS